MIEQALAFTGATIVAGYAPEESGELLSLVASVGVPRSLYGPRTRPTTCRAAHPWRPPYRLGRPLWPTPEEVAVAFSGDPRPLPGPSVTSRRPCCRYPATGARAGKATGRRRGRGRGRRREGDGVRAGKGTEHRSRRGSPTIGSESTGGRGIVMVAATAESWGTVPVSGGKHVWAEIVVG